MPNLNHLTHDISNLVSLIIKTKLGLSTPYELILRHCGTVNRPQEITKLSTPPSHLGDTDHQE
jgi:hypothetical protein